MFATKKHQKNDFIRLLQNQKFRLTLKDFYCKINRTLKTSLTVENIEIYLRKELRDISNNFKLFITLLKHNKTILDGLSENLFR